MSKKVTRKADQKDQKRDRLGRIHKGGMPSGHVTAKTVEKSLAREALRAVIERDVEAMTRAQIQHAKGISHLFMRDDAGRFVKVEDPAMIETVLNAGEEGKYFWVFTKDPSVQAYTDLMNRYVDKPKEQEQEMTLRVEDARKMSTDQLLARADELRVKLGRRVARKALEG